MDRQTLVLGFALVALPVLAAAGPLPATAPQVDFGYAFGYPHRLTVALPDSGDKTLVDCEPGQVTLAWSYDNLLSFPVGNFFGPATQWKVTLRPEVDGVRLMASTWRRSEGWLPVLTAEFTGPTVRATLEVAGGSRAALVRAEFTNLDATHSHTAAIDCAVPGNWRGVNPAGVDPGLPANARDALVAGWMARADRVILAAVGGDGYQVAANTLHPTLELRPGETRSLWLVRPYRVYESMLPELRRRDWAQEFADAKDVWRRLIGHTTRIELPDEGVRRAYYAGLADIFIMREPVPGDYIGTLPGTELYRATNPVEAAIASIALDEAGLPVEAADGYRVALDSQNFDGCWSESQGWARTMWVAAGFKSWFVMEHYRLTRDREFLANVFPRMLASSRWQEQQRRRTRVLADGPRPLTYGLLPRGMGDGGLKDDASLYGVFLPHNIWAVYADQQALRAAEELGLTLEAAELRGIYETARTDLLDAIRRGAIQEDGYRWIPGVAGKTSGSRWGVLNAAFPARLLPAADELITGTIRKMESKMSPGGLPIHTGWMEDGMWVAIAPDNLGETLLLRGDGDAVARYLYATLNHGTPLYSWCEERGPEPGAAKTTGDRQHLWTPVAVLRLLRDSLVFEDGDTLHLARGTDRSWLDRGAVGGTAFQTHFGPVAYELTYAAASRQVRGQVDLAAGRPPAVLQVHVRLTGGKKLASVSDPAARVLQDGETIEWSHPGTQIRFTAAVK
ncbi:hypothetical protein [Opitutus sp. GAS368]|jgi:hypothetical protein|uniref:hypothetical protein n=1 Tax=Opitutus sp. GAS368 TaxID=1882749 RepID=UPI00087D4F25|nr:hypothetical protein [Opitutus sp. GAS368]SDR84740.1 hypothetical protein SAMN05444173_1096 [Opitutus sp. GAS368]